MASEWRWAAMRAILMFPNCEGPSHKTVSTDHNFWRERRAEADSNRGLSAYQLKALPLGQTGSQRTIKRCAQEGVIYIQPRKESMGKIWAHGLIKDKLLISSLNALVQSAGFSLKMQPRLLLLPIFYHSSTTATVSPWVHLILSSNLSRKFKTLLQDLFSWHPTTSTQHLSWKNCIGFPFKNLLNIKSLVCVPML